MEIVLGKYRSSGSQIFSDRDIGVKARAELGLDAMESGSEEIKVIIPSDTWSVNSSFFGGLFEGSLKKMNKEEFLQKFRFVYNTGESLNPDLWENIEDDIQYVINNL